MLLALLLALGAGACRNPSADAAGAGRSSAATGPGPVVMGTVLDARSGRALAGALVRGPGGVEAVSDAQGRFVLLGLPLGAVGELVGTTEAGLRGTNRLRTLSAAPLEVVLHLR